MLSSGGRLRSSALVMLLVSLGAAVEVYDEVPADMQADLAYQEDNDLDTGPFDRQEPRPPFASDVMLYRLLKSLHEQPRLLYRPNWHDAEATMEQGMPSDLKQAVFKRLPTALKSSSARPQQKWKIKKGKALGPQMVCYFKLCAFRPH